MYALQYDARPQAIVVDDFNSDTWTDVAVAIYGKNEVEIFHQTR